MYRFVTLFLFAALLLLAACDNPVEQDHDDHDHAEAEGLILVHAADTVLIVRNAEVSDTLRVVLGEASGIYEVEFLDEQGNRIPEGNFEDDFSLTWNVRDATALTVTQEGTWSFSITGQQADTTALVLQLTHLGHPDFTTPDIITVVQ